MATLESPVRKGFYLNLVVVDASEAIEGKVGEKISSEGIFGSFFNKAATAVAKRVVTESKVAVKVAAELVLKIPAQVQQMGIELAIEQKFQHGSFVVLYCQIVNVQPIQLLEFAKGPEFATQFQQMLDCFHALELEDALNTVQTRIDEKVMEAMMTKLESTLPEKLKEGKILVECTAKAENTQASFFFDVLGSLGASTSA